MSELIHNPNKRSFTTPKGAAVFPHLNNPDFKFDDDGVYKVDLALDAESPEAQEFMELIDSYVDEAVEEQKAELKPAQAKKVEAHKPYFMEEDEEGEETGRVKFRFKANYQWKDKKSGKTNYRNITMFDSKGGKPLSNPPTVRHGSILKIAAKFGNSWYSAQNKTAGVTMYIQAVQILELAEGGGNAENFGFGEEEDYSSVADESSDFSEEDGYEADDDADADAEEGPAEGEGDF